MIAKGSPVRDLDTEVELIVSRVASASRYHHVDYNEILELVKGQLDNRDLYDERLTPIEF